MPKYFAFLRAINVGGHVVTMDHLVRLFEGMGFSGVETFIASGNVIFETSKGKAEALEKKIENALLEVLGYEVATFIRTADDLAAIAACKPFKQSDLDAAVDYTIAFLSAPLDNASIKKLLVLKTAVDDFHVRGREVYWLCRTRQSESTFSNAVLEKTIGRKSTIRRATTIQKILKKFGGGSIAS